MNKIIKSAFRITSLRNISNSMIHSARPISHRSLLPMSIVSNNINVCPCRFAHGKGKPAIAEKELFDFLSEEIQAEKKIQKSKTIPSEIDGFQVKLNGPEVSLEKQIGDEKIKIHFNINHSVDADGDPNIEVNVEDEPQIELKSKPSFEVNFIKDKTTFGFTCSFIAPENNEQSEEGYNDLFSIDEVTIFDGEWKDNHYAASGEVLDGPLYDLLMNYLEEKGISNEFVDKLSNLSTAYEHASYINLLSEVQKFTSK